VTSRDFTYTHDCHDLGGRGDVEAAFTGNSLHLAAQPQHDLAQAAVVHIHDTTPGNGSGVDTQLVSVEDVIVDHGRDEVVGCGERVEITGEMQVDPVSWNHLGVTAAGGAALDTETRAQRRLAQRAGNRLADVLEALGQADGSGGLALARGGGRGCGHQD